MPITVVPFYTRFIKNRLALRLINLDGNVSEKLSALFLFVTDIQIHLQPHLVNALRRG